MSKEYQPLDVNLHPIGVLMPGKFYAIEDEGSITLPEAGVYRVFVNGDYTYITCTYPGESDSPRLDFVNGTIEYFYFPAGTVVKNNVDYTGVYISKMK